MATLWEVKSALGALPVPYKASGRREKRPMVIESETHFLNLNEGLIGRTRKKTYGYRERDAAKRALFLAQLAAITPSQRVYIDESDMDERDDYGYG
jgi:hypothetical protein